MLCRGTTSVSQSVARPTARFRASPIYFFAAAAFCIRHFAHRFRVASAMRLRPAALILRRGSFASCRADAF